MLLKHSVQYLFARGVPGVVNFASLAVFTRLLTPKEYGHYALIVASIGLANAVLFQWVRLALLRYWPSYETQGGSERLLGTLSAAYLCVAGLTSILGLSILPVLPQQLRVLAVSAVGLLWLQAWYELHLEFSRSRLDTRRYSLLMVTKALLTLIVGVIAVRLGAGAGGLLLGLASGMAVPILFWGNRDLSVFRPRVDPAVLRDVLRYGLPLTLTFALGFIVSTSDRLILGWLLGPEAAGLYAVGYDLAQYTIGMLMMIINLAGYPLVVRALEREGVEAARLKLQQNGLLLLAAGLPATAGLIVLAQNVSGVLLGGAFQETSAQLIPLIAISALIAGMVSYYFNLAFQLGRNTLGQIWVSLVAAGVNVLLNVWWIPIFGVSGAAYATLAAYLVSLVLSFGLGRSVFAVPVLHPDVLKLALAAALMITALMPTAHWGGGFALFMQVGLGVGVYGAAALALDVGRSRKRLWHYLRARKAAY